jgi:hypothetical protein
MGTSFIFSAFLSSSFKNPAVMSVLIDGPGGSVSKTRCVVVRRSGSFDSLDVSRTDTVNVDTHVSPFHSETLGEQVDGTLRSMIVTYNYEHR